MEILVDLYSNKEKEIKTFLDKFFNKNMNIDKDLEYEIKFQNPIESADLIGVFVDNNDKYEINMWISLDKGFFINVTDFNADKIIRYLYERYPY
jgi:hypothetical protein